MTGQKSKFDGSWNTHMHCCFNNWLIWTQKVYKEMFLNGLLLTKSALILFIVFRHIKNCQITDLLCSKIDSRKNNIHWQWTPYFKKKKKKKEYVILFPQHIPKSYLDFFLKTFVLTFFSVLKTFSQPSKNFSPLGHLKGWGFIWKMIFSENVIFLGTVKGQILASPSQCTI